MKSRDVYSRSQRRMFIVREVRHFFDMWGLAFALNYAILSVTGWQGMLIALPLGMFVSYWHHRWHREGRL